VLARIIKPISKLDALRVLSEIGVESPAYRTLKRRLPVFAKPAAALSAYCAPPACVRPDPHDADYRRQRRRKVNSDRAHGLRIAQELFFPLSEPSRLDLHFGRDLLRDGCPEIDFDLR
jgi:hypothetical protein